MYQGFGQTNCPNFAAVGIPSILKTRAAYSSEARLRIYQTTRLQKTITLIFTSVRTTNLETLQIRLLTELYYNFKILCFWNRKIPQVNGDFRCTLVGPTCYAKDGESVRCVQSHSVGEKFVGIGAVTWDTRPESDLLPWTCRRSSENLCDRSLSLFHTDLSFRLFPFSWALIFFPAFTRVRKANETESMSLVNPVCLSVRPSFHTKQLCHHWTKLGEI